MGSGTFSIGDMQNDGKPDLIIPSPGTGDGKVYTLENLSKIGNINFDYGKSFPVVYNRGYTDFHLVTQTIDLNNDGNLDILAANSTDIIELIRIGGDFNYYFIPQNSEWIRNGYSRRGENFNFAVADIDGDGILDKILGSLKDNVRVYVADIDGDNKTDVVEIEMWKNIISIKRNISTIGNINYQEPMSFT